MDWILAAMMVGFCLWPNSFASPPKKAVPPPSPIPGKLASQFADEPDAIHEIKGHPSFFIGVYATGVVAVFRETEKNPFDVIKIIGRADLGFVPQVLVKAAKVRVNFGTKTQDFPLKDILPPSACEESLTKQN